MGFVGPGFSEPHGVCIDPSSGKRSDVNGPVYMVSPDVNTAAGPCLLRFITFNACPTGSRPVFIADVAPMLG